MSQPTLLQIVPTLARGGLARATLDTAQAIIAAGGTAIVASPGGTMLPDLLRLRATHVLLPAWGNPLWARLLLPARLAASLRQSRIDIVQSRSPLCGWVAEGLARRLGARWIATLHEPLAASNPIDRLIERRQLRADALVAVSAHVARDVHARSADAGQRLEVIASGINLDRFDPALVRADRVIRLAGQLRVPDGRHVVLCPTLFDHDRGQTLLIEAIKRLASDDVFCLLLGSTGEATSFERKLEHTIEVSQLHGRVQIGPYIEDMPAAYMLADVIVATGGRMQGFSRPLVEAQAMGRPVVAEEGGGADEALVPGATGWLAAPGDAAALADAIGRALSLSAEQRAKLAHTAQEYVRARYGLADSNRKLLQLFEKVTA